MAAFPPNTELLVCDLNLQAIYPNICRQSDLDFFPPRIAKSAKGFPEPLAKIFQKVVNVHILFSHFCTLPIDKEAFHLFPPMHMNFFLMRQTYPV